MCGRYAIYTAPHKLADLFGLINLPNLAPRYNAAPLQELPVIIHNKAGLARWGLLPPWARADDRGLCAKMINARAETAADKPAFAESWQRRRRCLIPADGFYEWAADRQPHFIRRADGACMAFAGLWTKTADVLTFTILTKDADGPAAALHHRMPVMIDAARAADWFAADDAGARAMITQAHGRDLCHHPVSRAVGKVANDDESLIVPEATAGGLF